METLESTDPNISESIHLTTPTAAVNQVKFPEASPKEMVLDGLYSCHVRHSQSMSTEKKTKHVSHLSNIMEELSFKKRQTNTESKASEISPSKREFHELLSKIEKEEAEAINSLFYFQPDLEEVCGQKPYLPPMDTHQRVRYTLVLDLDETLVNFKENEDKTGGDFHIRPFAIDFIKQMSRFYEIVIFTAAIKEVELDLDSMQIGFWTSLTRSR